jgi:hypothetical protein
MAGITSTKKIKGQKHFLAYITPSEAEILEKSGGKKTMTKEGVPAYPPSNDARGESRGRGPEAGNSGRERGAEQNRNQSTPSKNTSPNNNRDNDGSQTMQDYLTDQVNYTVNNTPTNTTISDDDRDRFFQTPIGKTYKEAADKAAIAKAAEKEKARIEKDRIDKILAEHRGKEPVAYSYGPKIKNPYAIETFIGPNKLSTSSKMRQLALKNLIDKKMGNKSTMPSFFEMGNFFNPSMVDQDYTYNSGITTDMLGVDLQDYSDMGKYGMTGKNMTDIDRMNRALEEGKYGPDGDITQTEFEDAFGGQPVGAPEGNIDFTQLPTIPKTTPTENEEDTGPDYRFGTGQDVIYNDYGKAGYRTTRAADGGIMGTRARRAMGGIMERVDQRQGYFLGKIVKGIGKAIGGVADAAGKVLKSDLGRYAIMAAGMYYGGGGASVFKTGGGGFMNGLKAMGSNFMSTKNPLLFSGGKLSLGKLAGISGVLPFLAGEAKPNKTSFSDRGGQLIDPISGEPNDMAGMRENIELAKLEAGNDPDKLAAIDQKYNNMLNLKYQAGLPDATPYNLYGSSGYRTTRAATGGRIGYAEGGLLDLGGMEKDYRAEGGFVPIGEYEKKDDVPARLSVNEFVMTADAVRGAGQGDIDKGAEIMENMMKNLENGGTVSEESQGNKGAQQMFETSERLGAVI